MLDDDDGPERYGEDPDAPAVLPRKPKASLLKKIAGDVPTASVGSSLDSFITKANEGLLDVKENPPSRERDLEAKVSELEKKLASAEERAKKAEAQRAAAVEREPVMPIAPQSRGWGGIVVAFVLGCGAMFAVSTLLLKKDSKQPEQPAVAQPTPAQEQPPAPTPAPQPQAQPETQAQVQTPAATPTPTPTQTPAPDEQTAATPDRNGAKVAAKKTPKQHTSSTGTSTKTGTGTGTETKPPDPAHSGSDELYNPF